MENIQNYNLIVDYIDYNPLAVVGTVGVDGSPHGAVVYICADDHRPVVYFLTKTETRKYRNIEQHSKVSLTIVNAADASTLQATGRAFAVHDAETLDRITQKITRAHAAAEEWLPPIAKLRAGAYVFVGIEIERARLAHYRGMHIGDEHIFTEAE